MSRLKAALAVILLGLSGCGIPPVDTRLISTVPADARSFAVAQQAVRACIDLYDPEKIQRNFRRAGFGVSIQQAAIGGGRTVPRMVISPPDDAVSVLLSGGRCYVGLENMTPSQSAELARIWVDAYDAYPNAASGDGLSDHVSGAWRHFFTEPARIPDKAAYYHRIYIAAYKTWPHGPYDPQDGIAFDISGTFPDKPGAAVKLAHAIECHPLIPAGPRSAAYPPCSGPEYEPG